MLATDMSRDPFNRAGAKACIAPMSMRLLATNIAFGDLVALRVQHKIDRHRYSPVERMCRTANLAGG
jgi:hypothetical protein